MLGEFARIKWCRADWFDHFSSIKQAPFVWPLDGTTKRGHTMTQNYQTRFAAFRYCITPLATIALAISGAAAELLTVDDDGPADFASIQAAIDASSDGDEIVVEPGTYFGSHPAQVVDLKGKAITLRSSAGAKVTFIDGENTRRGIACFSNEGASTRIEGFTIRHGWSAPYDYDGNGTIDTSEKSGGGLYAFESSPIVTRCTFTKNSAEFAAAASVHYGSPAFTHCRFTENESEGSAGALYLRESAATLDHCNFIANVAVGSGGAVSTRESEAVFQNCTLSGNSALSGGGINALASSLQLTDCTITQNAASSTNASWLGGGGAYSRLGTSTFTNCVFSNNQAVAGGGMYNSESSPQIEDCQFIENSATGVDESSATGIHEGQGGGIFNTRFSNPSVNGCFFTRNSATRPGLYNFGSGGSICVTEDSEASINNSMFAKNSTDGFGGAVFTGGPNDYLYARANINDCTFTDNTSAKGGGLYVEYLGSAVVSGSLFVGNSAYWEGGAICNTGGLRVANTVVCANDVGQIDGSYTDDGGNCLSNLCRDTDGDGRPDCSDYGQDDFLSVPDEYPTIEGAIDAAAEGALIEIAAGTYAPTLPISTLGKALHLRGAIDDEGRPATILDGEDVRSLLRCMNLEGEDTRIENLVLTRGRGFSGGAMSIHRSSPTLINCAFTNNYAEIRGGGMIIKASSSPTLINCTISNNTAYSGIGGGVMNWGSDSVFQDCLVADNDAWQDGGGFHNIFGNPILVRCRFTGNHSDMNGGGIYTNGSSSDVFILDHCTIKNNSAKDQGGGLYTSGGSCLLSTTVVCGNAPDQIVGTWIDEGDNSVTDACQDTCPADITGDGSVDGDDLTILLSAWGPCVSIGCSGDLNADGLVDGADLTIILNAWGACSE